MACCGQSQGDSNSDVRMPCRVCELVDKDKSIKRVKWCKDCNAYICDNCKPNIPKRALAMTLHNIEKLKNKIKETLHV